VNILGIIPARYASTRFPGKPLVDINGKSMIQHVYEQALKAKSLTKVIVATDDWRIFDAVTAFGGNVAMTDTAHRSGTDRCNEVLKKSDLSFDAVINIQGDEPFIDPNQIDQLAKLIQENGVQIASLAKKITSSDELFNPNVVKIIFNTDQEAIYFSRHAIPYLRDIEQDEWINNFSFHKHLGIYAYRSDILKQITQLSVSTLEKAESLEQLRWLENGFKIKIGITTIENIAIDTPNDLQKLINNCAK
jgi:3-deoxy-manno-octulosonate cytidylyltransferase (CMP-KDO synthetase)